MTRNDVLIVGRGEVAVIIIYPLAKILHKVQRQKRTMLICVRVLNVMSLVRVIVVFVKILGPGTYYLNKLAFTPHIIPTTNITIDWAMERWTPKKFIEHTNIESSIDEAERI